MTEENGILCITNDMPDTRSCTVRGEHQIICDGNQYRFNPEHGRDEATGRKCNGCLPMFAQVGHVCFSCHDKIIHAIAAWTLDREKMLLSIDRAVQRDNAGVRSSAEGYVPLPATALAVNEIRSYDSWRETADERVSTATGAARAVRFARAVTTALRTHELEEKAHRIQRTRCTRCNQLTLVWKPTMQPGDEVTVKCSNPVCGQTVDQTTLEIEHERQTHRITDPVIIAGQPVTTEPHEAVKFTPELPEHEGFDPLSTRTIRELRKMLDDDHPRLKSLRKTELITAIRNAEPERQHA